MCYLAFNTGCVLCSCITLDTYSSLWYYVHLRTCDNILVNKGTFLDRFAGFIKSVKQRGSGTRKKIADT